MTTIQNQSLFTVSLVACLLAVSSQVFAQVPARFYWKSLTGGKAVPVIGMSMSGNANPLDPSNRVIPDASFNATVLLAGFAQTFQLSGRAATIAVLVPTGRLSGEVIVANQTMKVNANGFGDPMLEFGINVVGPKAIKNIPDLIRYEPGFSLDLIVDLAIPIGNYDNTETLNLGQNRWYGRLASPIVWQIGPWIPRRRTTLEFIPSLWVFGDNTDFAGSTLSTDPMFELESHLTRDFHKNLWGSLDLTWITGGKASLDGVTGEKLDMLGAGFTLGYQINDDIQFTLGYLTSINDEDPTDLRMDTFKISLLFGWHPLIEGMKRLEEN